METTNHFNLRMSHEDFHPQNQQRRKKTFIGIFKKKTTEIDVNLEKRPSFWNKVARSASMIFNQQQKLPNSTINNSDSDKKTPEHSITSGLNSSINEGSDSDEEEIAAEVIVQRNRFNLDSLTKEDLKVLEDDLSALDDDFFDLDDVQNIEEENQNEEELDNKKYKKSHSFSDSTDNFIEKVDDNSLRDFIQNSSNQTNNETVVVSNSKLPTTKQKQKKRLSDGIVVKRKDSLSNILNRSKQNGKRLRTFSEIKQTENEIVDDKQKESKKLELKNKKKNLSDGKINRMNSLTSSQFEKGKSISRTNSFINSTLVRIDSFRITFNGNEQDEDEEIEEEEEIDENSSFLYRFSKSEVTYFIS